MQTADEWMEANWCEVNGGGVVTWEQYAEMFRRMYALPKGQLRTELKKRMYRIVYGIEDFPRSGPPGAI